MAYTQHQSNFNAFWSVRKTYPTQVEKEESLAVHFFSKQSVPGLQTTTRYYKNKGGEILPLTGTYIDAFTEESITGISLVEPKKLNGGVTIPEQIVVDITCPVAGKVDRLQMSSDSKWGNDFARKIVKADLSKPLTIKPFSFIPDGQDKPNEGLSIYQGGNKITDHYNEFDEQGRKVKDEDGNILNINGTEQYNELADQARKEKNEKLRSNAWKTYFTTVNVFVVEKMMEYVKTADLAEVPEAEVDVVTDEEADDVAF